MKNKIKTLLLTGCVSLALGTSLSSCQDYLDKEPDSTVSADDAFANFRNFQGFVEEKYTTVSLIKRNVTGVLHGTGVMMKSSILRLIIE